MKGGRIMPEQSSPISSLPSAVEPVPNEYDLLCEQCGYSLIGLMETRCPECGKDFDPAALPLARVPWLYRSRLGRQRAYWRTVWHVLSDPAGFAVELCRPVRIRAADAYAFRRRTIRIAVIGVAIPLAILMGILLDNSIRWSVDAIELAATNILGLVIFVIVLSIFLRLGTDLPTFIWKGLSSNPNDLAPVHQYASAPLAATPMFVLVVIGLGFWEFHWSLRQQLTFTFVSIPAFLLIEYILIARTAAAMMRGATGCSVGRQVGLFAYLAIHWLMMAILCVMVGGAIQAGLSSVMSVVLRRWLS